MLEIFVDLKLTAQVLKLKYFPKVSFLQAKKGNNPSYVWRSLLVQDPFVRKGLFGESVMIKHQGYGQISGSLN